MFAGPNGSGKSVLKSYLPEPLLGVYLNPDEIEAGIKKSGYADIHYFGIQTTKEEMLSAFTGSKFLQEKGFSKAALSLSFEEGRLYFPPGVGNTKSSLLLDFRRGAQCVPPVCVVVLLGSDGEGASKWPSLKTAETAVPPSFALQSLISK
jgi:hypothetical protein